MNKCEIVRKMVYDLNTNKMPDEPAETMLDRIIKGSNSNNDYKKGFVDGVLFLKCFITGEFEEETENIENVDL